MADGRYELTLGRTYYEKGFFNLGVEVSASVRPDPGPGVLEIAATGRRFEIRMDRTANPATNAPRVFGGVALRNWIQANHRLGDVVAIEVVSPTLLRWHPTSDRGLHRPARAVVEPTTAPERRDEDVRAGDGGEPGLKVLAQVGFVAAGRWRSDGGQLDLELDGPANFARALYAFVGDGTVLYIGKTSRNLRQRLYFYSRPGRTQTTNLRANKLILDLLANSSTVEILAFVDPGTVTHRGVRVNLAAGLEDELIARLRPPWNIAGL